MKLSNKSSGGHNRGFTLVELVVVLGVIAVLIVVQLPALAAGKSQSRIGMCAGNVRQLALACQLYANDNNDKLPVLSGSAAWAWDLPVPAADALLKSGLKPKTFYCPGTAPRFTDKENWAAPGIGSNSSLWNFGVSATPPRPTDFHIAGYIFAFSGVSSTLNVTNQNTTILPETLKIGSTVMPAPPASERVLLADATISNGAALPGYTHPANNYTSIPGGFQQNGVVYPHVSPHLKGNVPVGGNLGFKDGHVAWRNFELMIPRTTGGAAFWW